MCLNVTVTKFKSFSESLKGFVDDVISIWHYLKYSNYWEKYRDDAMRYGLGILNVATSWMWCMYM